MTDLCCSDDESSQKHLTLASYFTRPHHTGVAELDLKMFHEMKLLHRMRDLEEKGVAFSAIQLKDLKYLGGLRFDASQLVCLQSAHNSLHVLCQLHVHTS